MAKWLIGQVVYVRDGKNVLRGMITAIIEDKIFCDWPDVGVYRSQEDEKNLFTERPAPKRSWRQ